MTKINWPQEYELIPLSKLFVDFGYQRPIRKQWITQMADERRFQPRLVGALCVSARVDGTYAVMDGNQRLHVLQMIGAEDVWCSVYTGLSYEDEADFFLEWNFARGSVSPYVRYQAMVEAKIPATLAMTRIVEEEGFNIAKSLNQNTMAIGAVSALEEVFLAQTHDHYAASGERQHEARFWIDSQVEGPELLRRTLASMRDGWGEYDNWSSARKGAVIKGVARFLAENPSVTVEEMARVLLHQDPLVVSNEARLMQQPGAGSGKSGPYYRVISKLYARHGNKQLLRKQSTTAKVVVAA